MTCYHQFQNSRKLWTNQKECTCPFYILSSDAGTGGATGPPILGRSVNPIPTGEGRLSPPITTGPPNVFHLPTPLQGLIGGIDAITVRDAI